MVCLVYDIQQSDWLKVDEITGLGKEAPLQTIQYLYHEVPAEVRLSNGALWT
jgi:hypothetical protein